jgi:NAD(P)-dependent dehydrogenase (short-subunit alcohol dehydrogenase family)
MLPTDTFAGQAVLVTGGGTGLGKVIALEFARVGAAVGIVSRKDEHLDAGRTALSEAGARVATASADIRDGEEVAAAFDAIESELGPVTVLVNNAAANFPVTAAKLSPNGWKAVVDITLTGTFVCAHEFASRRLAADQPGAIVNIASTPAFTGGPGMAHSAAAKAGVVNLTKTLAVEWGPAGIRVNAIAPGLFPHDDFRDDFMALRSSEEADARRQPVGRVGERRELGWAATYLCSPYAGFISGHTLVIDGANMLRRHFLMPEFDPIDDQFAALPGRE